MKNSIIENLIAEVMTEIRRKENFRAGAVERVREGKALAIMGRLQTRDLQQREAVVDMYNTELKDLQVKLAQLNKLR